MDECAKSNRPAAIGLKSSLVRELSLIVLGSVLLFQTAALGDGPGFRAPLLDTPGTPSDFRSGASSTPNGPGADANDAEIKEPG